MIFLKTQEEIELLRESNQLVGKALGEVAFPDFSGMEGSQTRFVFQ